MFLPLSDFSHQNSCNIFPKPHRQLSWLWSLDLLPKSCSGFHCSRNGLVPQQQFRPPSRHHSASALTGNRQSRDSDGRRHWQTLRKSTAIPREGHDVLITCSMVLTFRTFSGLAPSAWSLFPCGVRVVSCASHSIFSPIPVLFARRLSSWPELIFPTGPSCSTDAGVA